MYSILPHGIKILQSWYYTDDFSSLCVLQFGSNEWLNLPFYWSRALAYVFYILQLVTHPTTTALNELYTGQQEVSSLTRSNWHLESVPPLDSQDEGRTIFNQDLSVSWVLQFISFCGQLLDPCGSATAGYFNLQQITIKIKMADDTVPLQPEPRRRLSAHRGSLVPEDALIMQFDASKRRGSPSRRRGSQAFVMGEDTIVMQFPGGDKRRLSSFCTTSSNEWVNRGEEWEENEKEKRKRRGSRSSATLLSKEVSVTSKYLEDLLRFQMFFMIFLRLDTVYRAVHWGRIICFLRLLIFFFFLLSFFCRLYYDCSDTQMHSDEGMSKEDVLETLIAHKQIIANIKTQNWPMHRKLKVRSIYRQYCSSGSNDFKHIDARSHWFQLPQCGGTFFLTFMWMPKL